MPASDPYERLAYDRARARANSGRPRRRVWASVLAPDPLFCALCGHVIDKRLRRTGTKDRPPPPWSATVDHIVEIDDGGDPLDPENLQPAHRQCNLDKESRRRSARAARAREYVHTGSLDPVPYEPTPIISAEP